MQQPLVVVESKEDVPPEAAALEDAVRAVNAAQPVPPAGWKQVGFGMYVIEKEGTCEIHIGIPPLSAEEEALRVEQAPALAATLQHRLAHSDPAVHKAFNRLRDRMEACKDSGMARKHLFAAREAWVWLKDLSDPLSAEQRGELGYLLQMLATCSRCAHRREFVDDVLYIDLAWRALYPGGV